MNNGFKRLKRIIRFLYVCALILFCVVAIVFFIMRLAHAETFQEVSIPYGFGLDHYTGLKLEYTYGKVLGRHWEVGMKGHIGSLMYSDKHYTGCQVGIGPVLRYKYPIDYTRIIFFIDAQIAIGHAQSPNRSLIESGVTGFIEGNIGLRTMAIFGNVDGIIGINFSHVSSTRPEDKGINMFGPIIGIRW